MPTPSGVGFAQDPVVTPGLGYAFVLVGSRKRWSADTVSPQAATQGGWVRSEPPVQDPH